MMGEQPNQVSSVKNPNSRKAWQTNKVLIHNLPIIWALVFVERSIYRAIEQLLNRCVPFGFWVAQQDEPDTVATPVDLLKELTD